MTDVLAVMVMEQCSVKSAHGATNKRELRGVSEVDELDNQLLEDEFTLAGATAALALSKATIALRARRRGRPRRRTRRARWRRRIQPPLVRPWRPMPSRPGAEGGVMLKSEKRMTDWGDAKH